MSDFSKRLTALRESMNYSKTKLAKLIGVSLSTYANWEYGYNDPDMDTLAKLANALNTTTDFLTGRTNNPNAEMRAVRDDTALTWTDLGMPYGGQMPDELKETYADITKGYFKRHPEMLNKE